MKQMQRVLRVAMSHIALAKPVLEQILQIESWMTNK